MQSINIVALLGETEIEFGLTGHVSLYCSLLDHGPYWRCNHTWSMFGGCTCVGTFVMHCDTFECANVCDIWLYKQV